MNVQHIPQHEENRYKVLKGRVANEHNIVFKTHQTPIRIYALLAQAVYKQEVTKGLVAYIRGQNKFYGSIRSSRTSRRNQFDSR
jgi:hypothetical protein